LIVGAGRRAVVGVRGAWLLALACLSVCAGPVQAADHSRRFEVRSGYLELADGVWYLNARLVLGLSNRARRAIDDGVPVTLSLVAEISRPRRMLPDETVASVEQRWTLQYHALSQRYLVTNENSGQQDSHATLAQVLDGLSIVRRLPIVDETLLRKGRRYDVSLQATVDIGGLPDTLKALMFWRDWSRQTDWYSWTVHP
jgi:Domain of unknown function (DUF4390)